MINSGPINEWESFHKFLLALHDSGNYICLRRKIVLMEQYIAGIRRRYKELQQNGNLKKACHCHCCGASEEDGIFDHDDECIYKK